MVIKLGRGLHVLTRSTIIPYTYSRGLIFNSSNRVIHLSRLVPVVIVPTLPYSRVFTDIVADPHHFNADPEHSLMRVHIQLFASVRIRIPLLIKVMRICYRWSTDSLRLHLEPPRLHCERSRPSMAQFSAY
jgi:hypothetical protein